MAIEFALFGLGSQKGEALLSKRKETGRVTLEFTVGGKRYEIQRALSRRGPGVVQDPAKSWMRIDGEKELLSPSELKQRTMQVLEFNEPADPKAESRIFRYAVFTPQEAMKDVLADPRKRLETIRRAFGIEDYSITVSNAHDLSAELKSRLAILQERFRNIAELESENAGLGDVLAELDGHVRAMVRQQDRMEERRTALAAELDALQELDKKRAMAEARTESKRAQIKGMRDEILRIDAGMEELKSELAVNSSRLEELDKIRRPDTDKSPEQLDADIARFQAITDDMTRQVAEKSVIEGEISRLGRPSMQGGVADLEGMLGNAQEQYGLENSRIADLRAEQARIRDDRTAGQTECRTIEAEIEKLSQLGNICPTCKQQIPVSYHKSLVDARRQKLAGLNARIGGLAEDLANMGQGLADAEERAKNLDAEIRTTEAAISQARDLAEKRERLDSINSEIHRLQQANIDDIHGADPLSRLSILKEQLLRYMGAAEQKEYLSDAGDAIRKRIAENARQGSDCRARIKTEEEELKRLEASDEFKGLDAQISEKKADLDGLRAEISSATGRLAQQQEKKSNTESRIRDNLQKIAESKKWQDMHSKVTEYRDWIEEFFIPATSGIERQVLLAILQDFNETYRRWYSILVDDPTKESRIDEDFTPVVSQDGYDQDVRYLSGGEKTSIALAYRLTLNRLMRKETETLKSSLLMLDEPTDGFSKSQLGKIRELLDELKSEQVILVSHERELQTYVDNVFDVSKHDGMSRVSAPA